MAQKARVVIEIVDSDSGKALHRMLGKWYPLPYAFGPGEQGEIEAQLQLCTEPMKKVIEMRTLCRMDCGAPVDVQPPGWDRP